MKLTKRTVKQILGVESDAALCRHFGLSRGAAFFWDDDAEIPEAHQITLLRERPELAAMVFGEAPGRAA